jgi:hypothetical protein
MNVFLLDIESPINRIGQDRIRKVLWDARSDDHIFVRTDSFMYLCRVRETGNQTQRNRDESIKHPLRLTREFESKEFELLWLDYTEMIGDGNHIARDELRRVFISVPELLRTELMSCQLHETDEIRSINRGRKLTRQEGYKLFAQVRDFWYVN